MVQDHHSFSNGNDVGNGASMLLAEFAPSLELPFSNNDKEQRSLSTSTDKVFTERRQRGTTKLFPKHVPEQQAKVGFDDSNEKPIELLVSPEELQWIKRRSHFFDKWYNKTGDILYERAHPTRAQLTAQTRLLKNGRNPPQPSDSSLSSIATSGQDGEKLPPQAVHLTTEVGAAPPALEYLDEQGPWLDFVIIGNP
ncbi:MAG: hypothetical protein SGILL_005860 [Bacillariaceae sp.]